TIAPDLPSPARTWQESRRYVLEPFFKDGEMNQGIGRLAFYSLVRVAKGFALALAIGTPIGFLLGLSPHFPPPSHPLLPFLPPVVASVAAVHAADLAAGVAAARPGDLPEVRARRDLHDRALRDVADGHQHGGRRPVDQPGTPERGPRPEALAQADADEDHRPGEPALCLHRLSALARPSLARHRRRRDADGDAGCG